MKPIKLTRNGIELEFVPTPTKAHNKTTREYPYLSDTQLEDWDKIAKWLGSDNVEEFALETLQRTIQQLWFRPQDKNDDKRFNPELLKEAVENKNFAGRVEDEKSITRKAMKAMKAGNLEMAMDLMSKAKEMLASKLNGTQDTDDNE